MKFDLVNVKMSIGGQIIVKNVDQCAKKSSVTHWAEFAKKFAIDKNIIFQTRKDKFSEF